MTRVFGSSAIVIALLVFVVVLGVVANAESRTTAEKTKGDKPPKMKAPLKEPAKLETKPEKPKPKPKKPDVETAVTGPRGATTRDDDDSNAPLAELHPHFKKFDLTRSGLKHKSVGALNELYENVEKTKTLFLGARESGANSQLIKLADVVVPSLVTQHSDICAPIDQACSESDRTSALLRDETAQLNAQISSSAGSSAALLDQLASVGAKMSESEDNFAKLSTLRHMCATVGAHLEQLRIETGYARDSVKDL